MVELNDFMQYKNVLSKRYLLPKDKQGLAAKDFMESVLGVSEELLTLPFFMVEPANDDNIFVTYYISIEQNDPGILPKGLHFDSYFGIDPMASIVLSGDFAAKSEEAYQDIYKALDAHGFRAVTPVFTTIGGDSSFSYATLKIGYADKRFFEGETAGQSQEASNGR